MLEPPFQEKGVRVPSEPVERDDEQQVGQVGFWAAGDGGKGDYRCAECSYGITVRTVLPVCPMCSGSSWKQSAWSPFSRAGRLR